MASRLFSSLRRYLPISAVFLSAALLSGCASFYLDPATKDVPVAEMRHAAVPQPVRLNFEFQTRGAPNSRATEFLNSAVREQLQASGLFSSLDGGPNAAILEVKLNNIPLSDDSPAAKGFVTGFTFGLVGSKVSDGYECKLSYLPPGQTAPVVKVARHAIHTTLGNASPPPGTIQAPDINVAVKQMTHAVLSNALRDLSNDPAFEQSAKTTQQ
jgi:hypothetical protein